MMKFLISFCFLFVFSFSYTQTNKSLKVNSTSKPDTVCIETFYLKHLMTNVERLFDNNGLLMEENDLLKSQITIADSLYVNLKSQYDVVDSLYYIHKEFNDSCNVNVKNLSKHYNELHVSFTDVYDKYNKQKITNKRNKILYLGIGFVTGITLTSLILK